MNVKVRPDQLRKFADDVMHETAYHYRSINDYVRRHCADTTGLEGLLSNVAPLLEFNTNGFHAATSRGAENLAATAEELTRTANLFEKDDDEAATRIWTAGQQKYQPPPDTEELPYIDDPKKWLTGNDLSWEERKNLPPGAGERKAVNITIQPAKFDNLPAPQIPPERDNFDECNDRVNSILKVVDQVLSKVGFSILGWIEPLIGDWGVLWKISDAWRIAGTGELSGCGFRAMAEQLAIQLTDLDCNWDGEAARAFNHNIFERWRPALLGAQQLANLNQQVAEMIAAGWEGLYCMVLAVVEYIAGKLAKILWKVARGSAGALLEEITGALKNLWVTARKLLGSLVEQAQAVGALITAYQGRDDLKVLQTG